MKHLFHWRKKDRYYNVQLQHNFFGGTSVICSWGSLYSNLGNYKIIPCQDDKQTTNTMEIIKKRRKARGYDSLA